MQFNFTTAALAAGTYTALVTVEDPNAVDAPQTITVTVLVGGGVPSRIDLYTAPGSSNDFVFSTNSTLTAKASTNDAQSWLTVALDGSGSFRFVYPYRVHVAPVAGQGTGTYNGTVVTSGSSFAGDNKTISVTMRVTTDPIVKLVPDDKPVSSVTESGIRVQLAEGAPRYDLSLILSNQGQGTLSVSSGTATGGAWLAVTTAPPAYAILSFDASKVSAGSYTGSVTVETNAANGNLTLPVQLTVVPKKAPLIRYQGVVDNAVFNAGDPVARGGIAVVLGDQLSMAPVTVGSAPPLATSVGGATILVNGKPAPMYYSTYGQLAFQMPFDAPLGTALVQVERDGQASNTVSVEVVDRAPRILRLGIAEFGAVVNAMDGSLPFPSSYNVSGWKTHPARRGDVLTIYAIGLGPTDPAVSTGAAAPSSTLASLIVPPSVHFGGGAAIGVGRAVPSFAGLSPGYAGLYQLNVIVPDDAPKGVIALSLGFPDGQSNVVEIAVE